ncbi:hypothetical protein U9M48_037953 [Paspalum notatum var. saurae]|uniref:Uncharacterized protein n=1 Tax=Paspalum notatum var. saurae TaxID=547442 RepID=A0AAQ3UGP0_PASNO
MSACASGRRRARAGGGACWRVLPHGSRRGHPVASAARPWPSGSAVPPTTTPAPPRGRPFAAVLHRRQTRPPHRPCREAVAGTRRACASGRRRARCVLDEVWRQRRKQSARERVDRELNTRKRGGLTSPFNGGRTAMATRARPEPGDACGATRRVSASPRASRGQVRAEPARSADWHSSVGEHIRTRRGDFSDSFLMFSCSNMYILMLKAIAPSRSLLASSANRSATRVCAYLLFPSAGRRRARVRPPIRTSLLRPRPVGLPTAAALRFGRATSPSASPPSLRSAPAAPLRRRPPRRRRAPFWPHRSSLGPPAAAALRSGHALRPRPPRRRGALLQPHRSALGFPVVAALRSGHAASGPVLAFCFFDVSVASNSSCRCGSVGSSAAFVALGAVSGNA